MSKLHFMNKSNLSFLCEDLNPESHDIHKLWIYEYNLREMCHDVRSQETCAQPIGEAPLAHPIFGC